MDARAKNLGFAGLAAHANIAVRLFNPFASRKGKLAFLSEGLRSFDRVNHRMHNKTWIADNRVAITGGRNLGDEYFGASDAVAARANMTLKLSSLVFPHMLVRLVLAEQLYRAHSILQGGKYHHA